MFDKKQHVQASILDRLLDFEPGNSREPVQQRTVDFRQIMAAVSRDLENLLNTRRNFLIPPPIYPEVNNSLFMYGLPDFTSKNPATTTSRAKLRLEISKAISRFEPRLKNISVKMDFGGKSGRRLKLRIIAVLVVDPLSEPVSFDTSFDANRNQFSIQH